MPLVAHRRSALARDDRTLLVAREALEGALAVHGVRDGRRRAVERTLAATRRHDLGALLVGLRRNLREDSRQLSSETLERSGVEIRIRTAPCFTELPVAGRGRRREDLVVRALSAVAPFSRDAREEAHPGEGERHEAEDMQHPARFRAERGTHARSVVVVAGHRALVAPLRFCTLAAHFL